jgi:hypothetical protein
MKQGLIIDGKGNKHWYLNDQLHRVDGPAVEWSNGFTSWFLNGKLHRENGPACELPNGDKEWFLNHKLVYSKDENYLHLFTDLSESFKKSIIKYNLST